MNDKYIFLDRDGVINKDNGYVHEWRDFFFIDGVIEALKILNKLNYKFVVVTNQSGIGRGLFTKEQYYKLTELYKKYLSSKGIEFVGIYHCPHAPNKIEDKGCFCRKPNPGMILRASQDHRIQLSDSIMVGDKITDMIAAKNAGINKRFLLKENLELIDQNLVTKSFKSLLEIASFLDLNRNF